VSAQSNPHPGAQDRWLDWLDRGLAGQPGAEAMVRDVLGPLIDYDARHQGDLVHTVEVLAACGWSPSPAARRLFLLRNSVLYRRSRIEEITGRSLSDPRQRLLLTVAARLHRHVQNHRE
jgi:DNA-binding PucR family transcriptional regulator